MTYIGTSPLVRTVAGRTGNVVLTALDVAGLNNAYVSFINDAKLPPLLSTTSFTLINVVDLGADPTGVADSAPAFRTAGGSNRIILVPPGTYRFKSTTPATYPYYDLNGVQYTGFNNFVLRGYGATIVVDDSVAFSGALLFDQCSNFRVCGLTIQGSRFGLTASNENGAFGFVSTVDFVAEDLHCTGNFGGVGAGVGGDYWINGVFQNIRMDAVGQAFDIAFLKNCVIRNVYAVGADTTGLSTAGHVGQKGISIINDIPLAGSNRLGIPFTQTDGVLIENNYITNFTTGTLLSSGRNIVLSNNQWVKNPGVSNAVGIGIYILYTNGGNASSIGVPVSNVSVIGDRFVNNGEVVPGAAVIIDSSHVANADKINNITFTNCVFDNNASQGLVSATSTGLTNVRLNGNIYSGAAQTTSINAALATVVNASTLSDLTSVISSLPTIHPGTTGVLWLNNGTVSLS